MEKGKSSSPAISYLPFIIRGAPVAQGDRASDFGLEGRRYCQRIFPTQKSSISPLLFRRIIVGVPDILRRLKSTSETVSIKRPFCFIYVVTASTLFGKIPTMRTA